MALTKVIGAGIGSLTEDVALGDSDKVIFGAGSDLQIYHDGSNSYIADAGTGSLYALTNSFILRNAANGESMLTATENGAVELYHNDSKKIETTSSGLEVTGRVNINHNGASDYGLYVINDGNNTNRYGIYVQVGEDAGSGTNYLMAFKDGDGSSVGSITFSGSNTSFNTSSDYRLKNNIADLTDATAKVKELKPKKFSWKKDTNNTLIHGFLAHEVAEVIPEAVVGEKDAVDDDDKPIYQGIDHSKIVPLLVKTIQELEARITALESA